MNRVDGTKELNIQPVRMAKAMWRTADFVCLRHSASRSWASREVAPPG